MKRHIETRQEELTRPEADDHLPPDVEPVLVVAKRAPGRKNTRSWCKGKVGREHTLAIEIPPNNYRQDPCRWHTTHYANGWEPKTRYICRHVELCTTCGKIFRRHFYWLDGPQSLEAEECPEYVPQP